MIFDESLCFEITVNGTNADVKKLVNVIKSGAFDDFFEFTVLLFWFSVRVL